MVDISNACTREGTTCRKSKSTTSAFRRSKVACYANSVDADISEDENASGTAAAATIRASDVRNRAGGSDASSSGCCDIINIDVDDDTVDGSTVDLSNTTTDNWQRVKSLLIEAVVLLCKNSVHYNSKLNIEGLLGVTVDSSDVFLVNINQTVRSTCAAQVQAEIPKKPSPRCDDSCAATPAVNNNSQTRYRSVDESNQAQTPAKARRPSTRLLPSDTNSVVDHCVTPSIAANPQHADDVVVIKTEKVDSESYIDEKLATFEDTMNFANDSDLNYLDHDFLPEAGQQSYQWDNWSVAALAEEKDVKCDIENAPFVQHLDKLSTCDNVPVCAGNNDLCTSYVPAMPTHAAHVDSTPRFAPTTHRADHLRENSFSTSTPIDVSRSGQCAASMAYHIDHASSVTCKVCGKQLSRAVYSRHLKTHLGRYLSCSICHRMFNRKDNLKRHLLLKHRGSLAPPYIAQLNTTTDSQDTQSMMDGVAMLDTTRLRDTQSTTEGVAMLDTTRLRDTQSTTEGVTMLDTTRLRDTQLTSKGVTMLDTTRLHDTQSTAMLDTSCLDDTQMGIKPQNDPLI